MTIDQIRTKVREITNTTTSDYADASLIRDLNSETVAIHTLILANRGPLEWDDPNQSGYSYEDLTVTAGTDTYDLQQDEHSENIYTVHKVVFNKKDIPRLILTEGNQDSLNNTTDTAVTPSGYYDLGKAIRFAEIPASGGTATIYYDRQHHYIETGDTSLELGLPRAYHQLACYRVAYNYATDKGLPNIDIIIRRIQEEEERLKWYEEERRGDEPVFIQPDTISGL